MMKMAHEPERIQKGLTIKKIAQIVENTYKYPIDNRRMSQKIVAAQYKKQRTDYRNEFFLLMKRSLKLTIRVPIGFLAVLIMAFINSFMIGSVFGGVGS